MPLYLLFASFLICTLAIAAKQSNQTPVRTAFIKSSILHALMISVATEILSFFSILTKGWLVTLWVINILAIGSLLVSFLYKVEIHARWPQRLLGNLPDFKKYTFNEKIALAGVVVTLAICLCIALISPPNNYDSMTYHMPRVMHWIQNQSVAHYPTHILRQISFPPGAGYIITHLQILSGGDYFANLVQWIAFLGCILGTALIAESMSENRPQVTTALICTSIPMAIMQSTTTQTDLVVSFWIICAAYFIFRTNRYSKTDIFWIIASLNLAILTKPTGIIFGIPLVMILGFRLLICQYGKTNLYSIINAAALSAAIFLFSFVLSLPSYWRNLKTFDSLLGVDTGTRVLNPDFVKCISNILKLLALNLPVRSFWDLIIRFHENILHYDINDSATSFIGNKFGFNLLHRIILPDEDFVGAPFHLLLMLSAILILSFSIKWRKNEKSWDWIELTTAIIIGFLLFCILIKWQMWANRLILPSFILAAPLVGYLVCRLKSEYTQFSIIALLLASSIFYSLTPIHRPIIALPAHWSHKSQSPSILTLEREDIYFSGYGKALKPAFNKLINHAIRKDCKFVGLDVEFDDWEYPIWVLLKSKDIEIAKIRHINVSNQSGRLNQIVNDAEICVHYHKRGRHIQLGY